MAVQNSEIADIFYEISDLLEIEGANHFRVRAYRNAARTIEGYPKRIYKMLESDENLEEISGIGEDLADKIHEIINTGNLRFLEELRARTPVSLVELLAISGLGPKRVQQLYHQLNITNIQELQDALKSGKVSELDGFGDKTVENILDAIDAGSFGEKRTRLDIAEQFVDPLIDYLKGLDFVENAVVAGSFRRRKATVGDLDIITISNQGEKVCNAFVEFDSVSDILSQGETKASVLLRSGLQVDLRVVKNGSFGAALLYFTGSKAHNIHLRNIAVGKGYKLNEYGVYKDDEWLAGKTEKEIYEFFGMDFIEPELREDNGEIEAALKKEIPDLLQLDDIRGDLQMHTTKSDGEHSVEELAQTADELGYEYIAITDHTSYIGVAQGLDAKEIESYINNIDDFNEQHEGVHILKGIEVDILKDGSLDLPDEVLEQCDIVLAAIHSYFDLSEKEQTARILKAIENPNVNILAHPTTRLIGSRDPIELDLQKIMEKALSLGCFLEINASPERLDLRDDAIRSARELGLKLTISTDAHNKNDLYNMKYGVFQARRGWASKTLVLNTLPLDELKMQMDRKK